MIIHIRGNTALSALGRQKLLPKLQASVPSILDMIAESVYFIDSQRELTETQCGQLVRLLHYGKPVSLLPNANYSFMVIPHLAMGTNWSFNATQIAHDCGLTAINRIERGTFYSFYSGRELSEGERQQLQAMLHDSYSDIVVTSVEESLHLYADTSLCPMPKRSQTVSHNYRKLLSDRWTIAGIVQSATLFDLIRLTYEHNQEGVLNAYQNQKAVLVGAEAMRFFPNPLTHHYQIYQEDIHTALQIANYQSGSAQQRLLAGAAIGQGAKPKAAFAGYAVADLQIADFMQSWEQQSQNGVALKTMLSAPLSNARAHNQFGLPILTGFFRTLPESLPLILSGSYGNMRSEHAQTKPYDEANAYFVKLGWNKAPRCCQDLIDACWALGEHNPLFAVHFIEPGETILIVDKAQFHVFEKIAERESAVYSLLEHMPEQFTEQTDTITVSKAPALPTLMPWQGQGIKLSDAVTRVLRLPAVADKSFLVTLSDRSVGGLVARDQRVGLWQVPVADVAVTLTNFQGYRGAATAVGERLMLAKYNGAAGARMAIGEALTNLAAAPVTELNKVKLSTSWIMPKQIQDSRLYDLISEIAKDFCQEADLTIVATQGTDRETLDDTLPEPTLVVNAFARIKNVKGTLTPRLRLNRGETYLVFIDLGLGKQRLGGSALAQVYQQSGGEVPDVAPATLKKFYAVMQQLQNRELLLAYHDRSDGGLLATLCEIAFATHIGLEIRLDSLGKDALAALFNEELGAVVQVRSDDVDVVLSILSSYQLPGHIIGEYDPNSDDITISMDDKIIFAEPRVKLQRIWSELSYHMQVLQGHAECAKTEFDAILNTEDPGLSAAVTFDPDDDVAAPFITKHLRPKIAILRRQGGTGHIEMAAAFYYAGFDCIDVHMNDLLAKTVNLAEFKGLVICSGFAYGDVLGAGAGWAKSILFNSALRDQFAAFFARLDTFTLGTGNGCQFLAHLKELIPGANLWPTFETNLSERFESRLCMVEVMPSCSLFMMGMAGSRIPVPIAHASGRAEFVLKPSLCLIDSQGQNVMRYIDHHGNPTEKYPMNPNGSPFGITGITNADGRITGLIPHPERVFRSMQMSWYPSEWGAYSPWMRMFRNARVWCA